MYETSANPNFDTILEALGPRRYVVFGVATEYCVRADVLALRERSKPVDLVVDAIRPITDEGGREALEEMGFAEAPARAFARREKMKTQPNSYCF